LTFPGADGAASSDFPPPNNDLKRSVIDCADAGHASMPQQIPAQPASRSRAAGRPRDRKHQPLLSI